MKLRYRIKSWFICRETKKQKKQRYMKYCEEKEKNINYTIVSIYQELIKNKYLLPTLVREDDLAKMDIEDLDKEGDRLLKIEEKINLAYGSLMSKKWTSQADWERLIKEAHKTKREK